MMSCFGAPFDGLTDLTEIVQCSVEQRSTAQIELPSDPETATPKSSFSWAHQSQSYGVDGEVFKCKPHLMPQQSFGLKARKQISKSCLSYLRRAFVFFRGNSFIAYTCTVPQPRDSFARTVLYEQPEG